MTSGPVAFVGSGHQNGRRGASEWHRAAGGHDGLAVEVELNGVKAVDVEERRVGLASDAVDDGERDVARAVEVKRDLGLGSLPSTGIGQQVGVRLEGLDREGRKRDGDRAEGR